MEDHHWRFRHAESLHKNGAKTIEWWLERSAYRCVRTSSSIFKLKQTCFVESSLVMRYWYLSLTWKPSVRAVSESLHSQSKEHYQILIDSVLWCEGHHPQQIFATMSEYQEDPATYALLSVWEEMRVLG